MFFRLRRPTPSTQVFSARRKTRNSCRRRDHFRHERQPIELGVGVEGGQNLVQAADGDGLAPPKAPGAVCWSVSTAIFLSAKVTCTQTGNITRLTAGHWNVYIRLASGTDGYFGWADMPHCWW